MERNLGLTANRHKIRYLGDDTHPLVDSGAFLKGDQAALGKELDPLQLR